MAVKRLLSYVSSIIGYWVKSNGGGSESLVEGYFAFYPLLSCYSEYDKTREI